MADSGALNQLILLNRHLRGVLWRCAGKPTGTGEGGCGVPGPSTLGHPLCRAGLLPGASYCNRVATGTSTIMSARFVIEPAWITTRTVPTWSARGRCGRSPDAWSPASGRAMCSGSKMGRGRTRQGDHRLVAHARSAPVPRLLLSAAGKRPWEPGVKPYSRVVESGAAHGQSPVLRRSTLHTIPTEAV